MFVYYVVKQNNIKRIFQQMKIKLNVYDNNIIYSKVPQILDDEAVIKFKIANSENLQTIKIKKNTFIFDRAVELENREMQLFFNTKEQMLTTIKNLNAYKEIKLNDKDLLEISFVVNPNKISIKQYIPENKSLIIKKYEEELNKKADTIKGMLYGALFNKQYFNSYIIKNYSKCKNELDELDSVIYKLRVKGMLNRDLYIKSKIFKNELERKALFNIKEAINDNLIFKFTKTKRIDFNSKYLNVKYNELILIQDIINYLIEVSFKYDDDSEKIERLLKYILNLVNHTEVQEYLKKDFDFLYKRINNEDYGINVNDINSSIFKNIYAFFIKYNNIKELDSFIREKEIKNGHIAFLLYGAFKGFSNMTYSLTFIDDENIYIKEVLNNNICYIENNILDRNETKFIIRDRIHYILNNIYTNLDRVQDKYEFANTKLEVSAYNKNLFITINDGTKMNINYSERVKNISSSIIYFDRRNERIKNEVPKFLPINNIIFNYNFIVNKKIKPLDYQYEYYFCIVLQEIYKNIRGEMINERYSRNRN